MQVDVLISTFDRLDTLKATVQSLRASSYKDISVFIAVDGNESILHTIAKLPVCLIYNKNRKDFVMSMNTLLQYARDDAVFYASDDLIFEKDCIEKAVKMLREKFPDTDGLIGIRQNIKKDFRTDVCSVLTLFTTQAISSSADSHETSINGAIVNRLLYIIKG